MEIFEGRPVEELKEIWQVGIVHRQSNGPILQMQNGYDINF